MDFPYPSFTIAALLLLSVLCFSCIRSGTPSVSSPDNNIKINFSLSGEGQPQYAVLHKDEVVIDTSRLGFDFKNKPPLQNNFSIVSTGMSSKQETWEPVWGENKTINSHFNELLVELEEQQEPNRKLHLRFRAFDDGVGWDESHVLNGEIG